MRKLISIVIPMYYEEEVIEKTYKTLTSEMEKSSYDYELIFVDDGSLDNTFNIVKNKTIEDKKCKCIKLSRNFGHQCATTAGINKSKGDAVVLIDADLQDPPYLIHKMLEKWEEGYDVVYGKRLNRDGESFFKLLSAKFFYKFLNYMSDTYIPENTGDFRLMDRKVVEAFNTMAEQNRFIRGMVSWTGFKQIPLFYHREKRYAGKTKYPLKKMVRFATNGIFSFSTKPLKIMSYIGTFSIITSLVLLIYSFIQGLIGAASSGWASIMVTVTFLGGTNLLAMGILGSYIGRIYDETRNRPIYIIDEEINIDDL
ncbi:MAG: glycosyltransferase family 2 protein [Lachnospirales bacterium]